MERREDDISDLLAGDEALRQSIEQADQGGEWRDPEAEFRDPKIEALKQQLREPQVAINNYTARRLRDLQQRAAAVSEPPAPAPAPDWRENLVFRESLEQAPGESPFAAPFEPGTPPAPASTPEPVLRAAAGGAGSFAQYALQSYPASIAVATLVFLVVGWLQSSIGGSGEGLALRVLTAGVLAGSCWRFLNAGRLGCTVVGLAVDLLVFSVDAGADGQFLGMFVGMLAALLLSGLVGILREEWEEAATRHA